MPLLRPDAVAHPVARRARGPGRRSAALSAALLVLLLALPARATAQRDSTGTVQGTVLSSTSGDPVARAVVTITGTPLAADADDEGRFTLAGVRPGRVTLHVRALGFHPADQEVQVAAGAATPVTVRLVPAPVRLRAVRTEAALTERERFEQVPGAAVVTISGGAMRTIPSVGEADVLRTVQLLPGVLARNDFSAGYNVRGGESDQNLVLLDGYPIYNPFHLGGLFGTFMDQAVQNLELMTGGFPAQYGGRLSSVLDVTSREEARQGVHGAAELSLLSSSAFLGGATPSTRGTWNVAARRTYADLVSRTLADRVFPYHFEDAQLHASHLLPGSGSVSLTGYIGRDVLDGSFAQVGDTAGTGGGAFHFDWGNAVIGATLDKPLGANAAIPLGNGDHLSLGDSAEYVQRVSFTRFGTHLDLGAGAVGLDNTVRDLGAEGELSWYVSHHERMLGYEVASHDVRYDVGSSDTRVSIFDLRQFPTSMALFYDDLWKPNDRWLARWGVRLEHITGRHWYAASPRLSLKYFLTRDLALTAAGGQYAQWMHALAREDLPIRIFDFWVASDRNTGVSIARDASLGVEDWLGSDRFVRVETYYKRYGNILEANPADDPSVQGDEFLPVLGVSYGADVLLRQLDTRAVSGWVSYSYGVSARRSGGSWYWPAQDRRHNLNAIVMWRLPRRLTVSGRFALGTGEPYTDIVGQEVVRQYDGTTNQWDAGITTRSVEPVGGDRNGARFPIYQRLDLSVTKTYDWRGALWKPYLSVVNVYNWPNVFTYTFDYSANPPTRQGISQFPILPSLGLTVEF